MTPLRTIRSIVPCLALALPLALAPRAHAQVDGHTVGPVRRYTLTNVTADRSIAASFAPNTCTLTLTVFGNGTVVRNPDPPGCGPVELTAIPDAGWHFVGWSGDVSGSANPLTFTLGGNKSITASFAINTCTLTLTVVGNGTVVRNPDQTSYSRGASVELTATPAAGEAFGGWGGDASGTNNPLIITMDGDKSITANFGLLGVPAGAPVTEFALGTVSPTPTSGTARFTFALPREARIRVSVVDIQGREVATVVEGVYPAGRHEAVWDGRGSRGALPAGVYVVRMQAPGSSFVKRMVVTR